MMRAGLEAEERELMTSSKYLVTRGKNSKKRAKKVRIRKTTF